MRKRPQTQAGEIDEPGSAPNWLARGGRVALIGSLGAALLAAAADQTPREGLDSARLTLGKWIEVQQIISKERNEWQQGKEVLETRIELVQREIATLEEKIKTAEASVAETDAKKRGLEAEDEALKASLRHLADAATGMEAELRRLLRSMPGPVQDKVQLLAGRMPSDPANTKASAAERFQNILGILNEMNKANTELSVNVEYRKMADGRMAQVQALYIGLAQAFYVSEAGEAGIGRPTPEGWVWEPSTSVARDVLMAHEIRQGKHSPAFVPLPVKLQ